MSTGVILQNEGKLKVDTNKATVIVPTLIITIQIFRGKMFTHP
jgi:hypothetical protein